LQPDRPPLRYFLDTEFNGFAGALISLALVPEDGGQEFYATLELADAVEPWVERHVMPYLDTVPEGLKSPRLPREQAAKALGAWLFHEQDVRSSTFPASIEIVADWPEDIAHFCMLLLTGPAEIIETPQLNFQLVQLPGFSTAGNSAVPHNALHDARALRDHMLSLE
jgi:hypothetical protein